MLPISRTAAFCLAMAVTSPLFAEVPKIPLKIYAQELVDETVAKNPDLLVMMMHVAPDKNSDNVIIASNIGRIGKKGDEDDMRVVNTGKSNLEVAPSGDRFEVELTLQEASKLTIGALGLVFPYKKGDDTTALEKKANLIRDDLSRHILHAKQLMEPFPYVSLATTKTHAQKLVDATMTKYPQLLILALHIGEGADYPIIGSSIGRIGKGADEDDLGVIKTGKPVLELNEATKKRFEVEVQLKDLTGKVVGAMSTVFPYKPGDAEAGFLKQAEAIRDDLQKQIPSLHSLTALDP